MTTYADLRRWDIIEAYHDRRCIQCTVLSTKRDGNIVRLKIHPVRASGRIAPNSIRSASFAANHPVEILGSFALELFEVKVANAILEILTPGAEPKTTRWIQDQLRIRGLKFAKKMIQPSLHKLREQGRIQERYRGGTKFYRSLLPRFPGLPIVELQGTRSEQIGWIERWQKHQQSGEVQPVIRLLNGALRFSTEEMIDPTGNPLHLQWIEQVRSGVLPQPPVHIPSDIIRGLDDRFWSGDRTPSTITLLEVAKRLELVDESLQRFPMGAKSTELKQRCVDYLNQFYPGWSYGIDVHLVWKNQGDYAA